MQNNSGVRTKGELAELRKCRKNPIYFLANYAYIKEPVKGIIKFDLYPKQEELLESWTQNKLNILFKECRQMGGSYAAAGFALWFANFYRNKTIKIISEKEEKAIEFLDKCKLIYGRLPGFLKAFQTSNATEMSFSLLDKDLVEKGNGSLIASLTASENAGRSDSLSLLIIDEAAVVPWGEEIWASAFPTLATGGKAIVLSTANGVGNVFHRLWTEALNKENDFIPFRLKWDDFPGRDAAWLEEQRRNLPPLKFAQEIMGNFIQSGSPVFDQNHLKKTAKLQKPILGRKYLIGADPAEGGMKSDPSVIQVIDSITGDQVHRESGKWAPDVFAKKIVTVNNQYQGVVGVERNNHGHAVIMKLLEIAPEMELYMHTDGKYGFPTNTLTKPLMIDSLEEALRNEMIHLSDDTTIRECTYYQYKENGSTSAPSGYHDDCVLALAIAWQMRRSNSTDNKMLFFEKPQHQEKLISKYSYRNEKAS